MTLSHQMTLVGLAPPASLLVGAIGSALVGLRREASARLHRAPAIIFLIVAIGAALAELALLNRRGVTTEYAQYGGQLTVDRFAVFTTVLACAVGLGAVLAAPTALDRVRPHVGEFHTAILLAVLGTSVVGASREMVTLFLGGELVSLSLVVLTALAKRQTRAVAAAFRLLVLHGAAAALTVYGLVLLYGLSGRTDLAGVAAGLGRTPVAALAVALILVGMGSRLGLLPLWGWVADSLSGALAPVAAVGVALSGITGFAALARITGVGLRNDRLSWTGLAAVLAAITLGYGSLRAMRAADVRQLTASLVVVQAGAVLVGMLAQAPVTAGGTPPSGLTIAMVAVLATATAVVAIGVGLAVLEDHGSGTRLRGLAGSAPGVTLLITAAVLSLGGVPPLFGFVTRLTAIEAASAAGFTWLALLAVAATAVSALAAIRAVALMYTHEAEGARTLRPLGSAPASTRIDALMLTILLVVMPLLAQPLYRLAEGATASLLR